MSIFNLLRPRQNRDHIPAAIITTVLSLLPDVKDQAAFRAFLHERPPLLGQVMTMERATTRPAGDILTRYEVAITLVTYASLCLKSANFEDASGSLLYSMMFLKENPFAWAGMAEVYVVWQDRIAARWAQKVLDYRHTSTGSEIVDKVLSRPATMTADADLQSEMIAIIQICSEHPDWRDSYPMRKLIFNDL